MALFKDVRNGQLVEFIAYHDREYAMVRNASGAVSYPPLIHLVPYEPGTGVTGASPAPQSAEIQLNDDVAPVPAIPVDTRLNVNAATADHLSKLKGIGFATAKRILELRSSLPGEKFRDLEQLRRVPRVDWDEVFKDDQIYVA